MASLLDGARKLVTRGTDIGSRIEALDSAISASRGRLDEELLDDAADIVERASSRMRLSADHTVVALAGATGSGKSSTFNALTGLELAAVGVRRPTTSWATACVWGGNGAEELLTWLGIAPRHQVVRDSMLDTGRENRTMGGVVLLDLPDHDSTELSHHLEVDRLVKLADLLVWVLDPQKYADAAIHDRYLRPLATHKDVMVVVLNHLDTVPEDRRGAMVADVRRLLDADGLAGVPIFGVSAKTGLGLDDLRTEIAGRVKQKESTKARFSADLKATAHRLDEVTGNGGGAALSKQRVAALDDALADAAGVPTVVAAVESSTRMRANRVTGWPMTAWVSRLKPDPLKRLHLNLGAAGRELTGTSRTSLPEATRVQRARVDTEVRKVADDVSTQLSRPWANAVRSASTARLGDLNDRLDQALAGTDLDADRIPVWAGAVRALQWILMLAWVVGALWLAALFAVRYLNFEMPPTPKLAGFPLPLVLLVGGILLGILLALACRGLVGATARSRARSADKRLRAAIGEVSSELVVGPVQTELTAYAEARRGLDAALR